MEYSKKSGVPQLDETLGLHYIKFRIGIRDYGDGMPKDKLDSLFRDFSKLEDSNNKNSQGRGLGLSIVKQIVERMNGSVAVESELGKGTLFTLTFSAIFKMQEQNPSLLSLESNKRLKQIQQLEHNPQLQ